MTQRMDRSILECPIGRSFSVGGISPNAGKADFGLAGLGAAGAEGAAGAGFALYKFVRGDTFCCFCVSAGRAALGRAAPGYPLFGMLLFNKPAFSGYCAFCGGVGLVTGGWLDGAVALFAAGC